MDDESKGTAATEAIVKQLQAKGHAVCEAAMTEKTPLACSRSRALFSRCRMLYS
jgi:hypothetical protein